MLGPLTDRLRERLANGMIEEVEQLHAEGVPWETLEFYGLEYRFIALHLKGELNLNDIEQRHPRLRQALGDLVSPHGEKRHCHPLAGWRGGAVW